MKILFGARKKRTTAETGTQDNKTIALQPPTEWLGDPTTTEIGTQYNKTITLESAEDGFRDPKYVGQGVKRG